VSERLNTSRCDNRRPWMRWAARRRIRLLLTRSP